MAAKKEQKVDTGEAVGIVAAQSIGEPGTQMSLAHDEKILVSEGGEVRAEKIGEFVDSMLERFGFTSENGHEICDLPQDVNISAPSLAENEKLEWRRVSALTRHGCNGNLLRISTRSGRTITATPFHSFVVRKENEIIPVAGSSLKKGDRLPVLRTLSLASQVAEAVDIKQALETHLKYMVSAGGKVYAYPRASSRPLPQHMELDEEFGWLVGIYLAEGNAARTYTSISSTEAPILEKIRGFAGVHNLTFNEYDNLRGFSLGHDIRLNSTLLAQFLKATCGTGSYEKKVPEFAYSAGEPFVCALLRGYFDGDGNVNIERKVIRASSKSKILTDGITLLLARLGIFASKRKDKQGHSLSISHQHAKNFLEKIGSDLGERKSTLSSLASAKSKTEYNLVDVIPGVGKSLASAARALKIPSRVVNSFTKRDRIGRSTLLKYVSLFETLAREREISLPELDVLRRAADGDVVWDEITDIEQVQPSSPYVYDFTVPGSETFATFDGIITHNTMRTFHYAGVAEQVPMGLPRLIEIVDARRAPKKPMMDIYLKGSHANDEKAARRIAEKIEEVPLSKISEISENFLDKLILVLIDEKELKEEALHLDDVIKKIKALCGAGCSTSGSKITITPRTDTLRAIRRLTSKLKDLRVKGVKGIMRAVVLKEKDEYFIRTGGSNLSEIMSLPEVDSTRCYTNDIKEIERTLGLEAARNAIIREAKQVLDLQRLDVDIHHLMLLADAMTMDGEIKPVGRHGLSGEKASILARAAFEETIKHLVAASIKAEDDLLVGVTENIIIGQPIPVGTGLVKLKMRR
ncbi:MAG: DNA-directed RNA polymerase subunit A'' [Candidatus Micrarchaeota archaeon]